jgi:class 3 adenylate cyclase
MSRDNAEAMANLAKANWPVAAQTFADLSGRTENPDLTVVAASVFRESTTGEFVARLIRAVYDTANVIDLLPAIRMPVLVMQQRSTQLFTAESGREVAAGIPGARFLLFEASTNWLGQNVFPELVDAITSFLGTATGVDEAGRRAATAPGTAIILFTDIVHSSALTERMGDAPFREASRALDNRVRAAIRDAGGTDVAGKLLGDGVMGVFTSAAQAIAAARACVTTSGEMPLHVGLHAGDVIREDDNVYGGAVNIAARICDASAPGEILVSQTVRDLARTSAGVTFEDRGERQLKGIADAVRVYAVQLPG